MFIPGGIGGNPLVFKVGPNLRPRINHIGPKHEDQKQAEQEELFLMP